MEAIRGRDVTHHLDDSVNLVQTSGQVGSRCQTVQCRGGGRSTGHLNRHLCRAIAYPARGYQLAIHQRQLTGGEHQVAVTDRWHVGPQGPTHLRKRQA